MTQLGQLAESAGASSAPCSAQLHSGAQLPPTGAGLHPYVHFACETPSRR
jgi:hypothetical protein